MQKSSIALLAAGIAGVMALGACSSSSKSSGSSSSSSSSSAASAASGTHGSSSEQLTTLSAELKAGKGATYSATYTVTTGTQTLQVTLAQAPPKSLVKSPGGEVISDGTTVHFCSTGAQATCLTETGANPLSGLVNLFDPTTALNAMTAAAAQSDAHAAGYNVTFSSATFAGQASTCANVSGPAGTAKYCVTGSGILSDASAGGSSFQLTSFTTVVPASTFSLPAGASSQTLPSNVTYPPGVTVPSGY